MTNKTCPVIRFEASRGTRLHRYFWAVTLTEITDEDLWWNRTIGGWEKYRKTHTTTIVPTHPVRR